ncbi:MAG: hypothetical protein WDN75_11070 [Bacteroidota bacterium]
MMGKITPEKSIPALKKFLENGGKIVTIGTSTNLAYHLGIPREECHYGNWSERSRAQAAGR